MTNKTPPKAISLIKTSEGCELRAYFCPAGIATIGYGHTKTVTKDDVKRRKTITEAEAERLLKADLGEYEAGVRKLVKVNLTDDQFGSLVSFAYNLGVGALASSTLLKRINAKAPLAEIERSWLQWDKARVGGVLKPLAGLTKRRKAEFALFAGR
ncbi:lysozyme [Sinorhizobium meliloti]|uniref:lysozyme n=1 Tax=Rhizobium meliloti TaxID=382 RepID=UPI00299D5DE7|nr:glycoside hydrolase family protein [Sinorhizobium meliloti]MDW9991043.1 glycoside hydrolase family protein [Sinorhizobium meliloti]MDX0245443.1 glycoside hydrolase family protein [Sinorhizobium meliloti]MDX0401553.1 glycoside hydrolase family protein [Sinorhizobium meliloti]